MLAIETEFSDRLKKFLGIADLPAIIAFDLESGDLNIDCFEASTLSEIVRRRRKIARCAMKWQAPYVNLTVRGEAQKRFPPELVINLNGKTIMAQTQTVLTLGKSGVLDIPHSKILYDLAAADPDIKVVRFAREGATLLPGAGIIAGANCEKSSGISPDRWAGKNMDCQVDGGMKTWIPDEWQRFCGDLLEHGWLPGYEWRAFLYTGKEVIMHGNVQLGWHDGLVRIVKILDCVPV